MAMSETDIKIIIAAELKKQGFDKAQKATSDLENSFKRLGKTVAGAFAAGAVIKFAKDSVKAFMEDDRAAKKLQQSLTNLGLAYNVKPIEDFISKVQAATGVSDSELRPAITELLTVTMDAQKSMNLLNTAMDLATSQGVDLQSATVALTRAYNGNYTSLGKIQRVYTAAELQAMGFEQSIAALNDQFGGAAKSNADTYAGKVDRLKVAIDEAKEAIGKGLLDALQTLANGNFDDVLNGIAKAAENVGNFTRETAKAIAIMKSLLNPKNVSFKPGATSEIQAILDSMKPNYASNNPAANRKFLQFYKDQLVQQQKILATQKKAAADAAAKEKANQALKRAGTVFDMQNIQIVAALQGKVTEEQRLRLIALLAINNDIADAADKTTKAILAIQSPALAALGVTVTTADNATTIIEKLIKAQTQILLLNTGISSLPKAANPFEDWDKVMKNILTNLDAIAAKIKGMPTLSPGKTDSGSTTNGSISTNPLPDTSNGNSGVGGSGSSSSGGITITANGIPVIANTQSPTTWNPAGSVLFENTGSSYGTLINDLTSITAASGWIPFAC